MRVCLFEDHHVAGLEPLTLTRPAYELLCGLTALSAKQWGHFAPCVPGVLVRPHLAALQQQQRSGVAVNNHSWLRAGPTVLVNARWLPPADSLPELAGPCVALAGDEIAYAVVAPDRLSYCSLETIEECLNVWKETLPHREAGGRLVRGPWELVDLNGAMIAEEARKLVWHPAPHELAVVGPRDQLFVDPTARIDPLVVADTTAGPVVIDRQAVVTAFTRLEGPCYIGPATHVLGAKVRAGTTLGPQCRIGGEVEASIVHGHSNKYHEGFLGHSYLGEWVNLGAGTHNSDLRNDYGEVTVTSGGERVATGRTKVGCFLGDHTKSGLGALLNTGSHAGVFCNLLPSGGYLPKYVPSFASVWNGVLRPNTDLPALLETARTVMQRRGCALTPAHEELYCVVHAQTAPDRDRTLHDADRLRLRRSA